MDYPEAINKKTMLEKELHEINKLQDSSKLTLSILPILVHKEFERLSDDIGNAIMSMIPPMHPMDIRIPVEGESMLSKMPVEFELSSAEATENFKQKLSSELEELTKSTARFPFTSEYIQKVITHTEAYLKKQRLNEFAVFGPKDDQIIEMKYNDACVKKDRLWTELNLIRGRASVRAVDLKLLPKLMDAEFERLSDDIGNAVLSDEIKVQEEGALMLSSVPVEYRLLFASDTEKFIQRLSNELKWVMSLPDQFPLTFQFIQRVIGYAERYMREKRQFEVAVFGRA